MNNAAAARDTRTAVHAFPSSQDWFEDDAQLLHNIRRSAGAILPVLLVPGYQCPAIARSHARAGHIVVGRDWVDYILSTSPDDFARHDALMRQGLAEEAFTGKIVTIEEFDRGDEEAETAFVNRVWEACTGAE